MTQEELEGELAALRSRLTQLEDERSARRSEWDKIASQSKWIGFAFAAATIIFGFAQIASMGQPITAPLAMPFLLTAIVLGLLTRTLRTVPGGAR
jgi:hypothetical protein